MLNGATKFIGRNRFRLYKGQEEDDGRVDEDMQRFPNFRYSAIANKRDDNGI